MTYRAPSNEGVGARTQDLRLKRPLLYQLSYTSAKGKEISKKWTLNQGKYIKRSGILIFGALS
jgi:hypothetical protein